MTILSAIEEHLPANWYILRLAWEPNHSHFPGWHCHVQRAPYGGELIRVHHPNSPDEALNQAGRLAYSREAEIDKYKSALSEDLYFNLDLDLNLDL